MLEKILLANSGTGNTEAMLKVLLEIPTIQRASVNVLHVVPRQSSSVAMATQWEMGGKLLAESITRLNLDPQKVTALLREGEPKDVVCTVANEVDANLIIMGSRGLRGLKAILNNSVSQYVFQLSSRPMLLVKDDLYAIKPIKRILVALDKSDASQEGLKLAIKLLQDVKNSELVLVHSVSNLRVKPFDETDADPNRDPILIAAAKMAKSRGIRYKCIAPEGKAGTRICQIADDMNVNLLILGSPDRRPSIAKGLPDLDRLLGDSLSDYVRVYAPCPVLMTRIAG